ncbi:hypothetical protein [Halosimplex amylolyticum]|uniref:hypothetical protein n=1 Tax=Halosimplex amylolyticum TaxID=3396616 RepID=UPI003F579971
MTSGPASIGLSFAVAGDLIRLAAAVAVLVQQFFAQIFEGHPAAVIPVVIVGGAVVGYVSYRLVHLVEPSARDSRSLIGTATSSTVLSPSSAIHMSRYEPPSEVLYAALAFLNVAVLAGIAFAVETGRPRFFGMTVIGVATVALADAMIFRPFDRIGSAAVSRTAPFWAVVTDRRFAASALLASVGVLFSVGRGLAFFSLVAVFVTSITLHVCVSDRAVVSIPASLSLLAGGAGLLLTAQVLTVPYYVRTLDTLYHTALARRIATVGSLAPAAGTRYADLPVFHTLAAVYVQLSGADPRTTIGVFFAVAFPVVVLAGYAFVRNVAGSSKIGFLGAALLAVNPEFVGWGSQAHVQSLSFVFLAVFVLLLSKWADDVRYTLTAGVVVLAWVMTHHLSVFMSVVLTAAWIGAGMLWSLLADRADRERLSRPLQQSALLVAAVGVYWWVTGLIWVPINWLTEHSTAASTGLPTEQFVIRNYETPLELAAAAVPFVLNNLHYAFFMAVCGYGLWAIVRAEDTMPRHVRPKVVVGFLVAAPLYMPNPIWMVARGMAALNRWGIMTLLFLLPVGALGLRRLAGASGRSKSVLAVALIVFAAAFVSVGAGFTDPSLSDAAGYDKGARKHFSTGNIASGEHVSRYTGDTPVHSSHAFSGYLRFEEWTGRTSERPERFGLTPVEDGRLVAEPGLTVVEYGSLRESHVKLAVTPERSEVYQDDVTVLAPVSSDEVAFRPDRENVVYHNADTMILFEPQPAETSDDSAGPGT